MEEWKEGKRREERGGEEGRKERSEGGREEGKGRKERRVRMEKKGLGLACWENVADWCEAPS